MDTTKIDIRNEREGVYRIVSLYSRDSIAITSQGLLELATWTEENKATLENEATKEKGMDRRFRSKIRLNIHTQKLKGTSHINHRPDGTTD